MIVKTASNVEVMVGIITRTFDDWARADWMRQIRELDGKTIFCPPEAAVEYIGKASWLESVVLDDVNPEQMHEAQLIVEVLMNSYPVLRSAVMIPDELIGEMAHLCRGSRQHVMLHPHSAPSLPMFEYLCRKITPDEYIAKMQARGHQMPIFI